MQRFVDASIIGWAHYIYGDNKAANALIKKDNPDISDELLAFSVKTLREDGIVDSGDSFKAGIGAMTDERMKASSTRWWPRGSSSRILIISAAIRLLS